MKRILYSTVTKTLAVILCVACIVLGVLVITDCILRIDGEEVFVYGFENSFEESDYIQGLLEAPVHAVIEAFRMAYSADDESPAPEHSEQVTSEPGGEAETTRQDELSASRAEIPAALAYTLNRLYCASQIDYFVEWNGQVFSNCEAFSHTDILNGAPISLLIQRDQSGGITTQATDYDYALFMLEYIDRYDADSTVTVCVGIKDDYTTFCKIMWERQAALVTQTVAVVSLLALGALLLLVYLVCVCGKNRNGEQTILWIDYVWSEIHLAAAICAVVGGVLLYICVLEEALYAHFPTQFLYPLAGALAALVTVILLNDLLSIVRNIKARRGVKASLILSVLCRIGRGLMWVVKKILTACKAIRRVWVRFLSKKTGALLITSLFVYTALIGLCGVFAFDWHRGYPAFILVGIALFVLASVAIAYRSADLDEIRTGAREIRSGNVTYQIPTLKGDELKPLADDINSIAQGLDQAVSAKLKAERMKAELITNVSHDIKTPLTSIINYTELLSQVEGLPEEARDYVEIIAKKNLRLKNLTRDLFDISRVQSGNEEMIPEKLDVALLIEQSLGELDSEIRASRLPFCVHTPKELYILADGRKMSRVVGNLLSNILKYAMENTRVFITATCQDGQISLEFKNVSASPLDFDPEEIVGRFVRGDESRTTEGSGLGLAIAKSYTELCGGRLTILLDGDLFKAILTFPPYPTEV